MINIAVAADNNYVQHLGVMLYSLFVNNQNLAFHVYLLGSSISDENILTLKRVASEFQNDLFYVEIETNNLKQFKVDRRITIETYFRLLVPVAVPEEVVKVLYLDADMIVADNIAELWNTDVSDYALAAVRDVTTDRSNVLSLSADTPYFNAGVLLVNLERWRSDGIAKICLDFLREFPEKILYHDQDALNAVLYNQWLPLHPKYNMQGPLFMDEFDTYFGDTKQLREAIAHPVIIHYSAPQKPWHYLSFHPYTQEYFKYLALTPWKGYQPADKTPIRVVRKFVRPHLKKMGITKLFGKSLY